MRWLLILSVLAACARADERVTVVQAGDLSIDGGVTIDTPLRTVNAPPPLNPAGALDMAEIPAARRPAGFTLIDPAGRIFGPYAFADGVAVGSTAAPFILGLARNGTFSLTDPRAQVSFGPFTPSNGAPVTVGQATLSFTRLPGSLRIRLSHRSAIGTAPRVAAGEFTPALQNSLYDLRDALVRVANRLAYDTASVTFEGVPTLITPWNHRQEPIVKKSLRDRETARQTADRTATALLEAFMRARLKLPLAREPDGGYLLQPTPSGACVVCVLWRVTDPDAVTAAAARTAVWWTTVSTEPSTDVRLDLGEAQAGDWRGVFRLPPLRD